MLTMKKNEFVTVEKLESNAISPLGKGYKSCGYLAADLEVGSIIYLHDGAGGRNFNSSYIAGIEVVDAESQIVRTMSGSRYLVTLSSLGKGVKMADFFNQIRPSGCIPSPLYDPSKDHGSGGYGCN